MDTRQSQLNSMNRVTRITVGAALIGITMASCGPLGYLALLLLLPYTRWQRGWWARIRLMACLATGRADIRITASGLQPRLRCWRWVWWPLAASWVVRKRRLHWAWWRCSAFIPPWQVCSGKICLARHSVLCSAVRAKRNPIRRWQAANIAWVGFIIMASVMATVRSTRQPKGGEVNAKDGGPSREDTCGGAHPFLCV